MFNRYNDPIFREKVIKLREAGVSLRKICHLTGLPNTKAVKRVMSPENYPLKPRKNRAQILKGDIPQELIKRMGMKVPWVRINMTVPQEIRATLYRLADGADLPPRDILCASVEYFARRLDAIERKLGISLGEAFRGGEKLEDALRNAEDSLGNERPGESGNADRVGSPYGPIETTSEPNGPPEGQDRSSPELNEEEDE